MNKKKAVPYIISSIVALLVLFVSFYVFCPAINLKNIGFWSIIVVTLFVFSFVLLIAKNRKNLSVIKISKNKSSKGLKLALPLKPFLLPLSLAVIIFVFACLSSTPLNAKAYSKILTVKSSDFASDLAESVGTDSIALMDTASAQMLGDREIGTLSNVVSQFDVSYDYTQIDYHGKPIKVSPLEYAGFFKWCNNKSNGVKGYVSVDPVSMSAKFNDSDGMKYVPSAFFSQDAFRYLRTKYPTLMLENLHFEIDENGKPFYIASIVDNTIFVFGGKTVVGCVALDPVSGETFKYDLNEIPKWIDVVFNGDLICEQFNWHGMYQNGFFNSLFAKKDCKQVTTYYSSAAEDEETSDETPVSDYGYISKDGDIWIYTGITSVNGDSSNIGFLLANERTGESRYYAVAGADEKSAMTSAEGEVQEKGYQASFPSLININGNPTYIMVLKDSGGLVKLYAAVNVEQYNIVTTAATQAECIAKYKSILGISDSSSSAQTKEIDITIFDIKYIDIDGNTFIYIIDTDQNIYKAKAYENENMLLLQKGDVVSVTLSDNTILSCKKK